MTKFYTVGLHRSGTNYIKELLFRNFHCSQINTEANYSQYWKHSINVFENYDKTLPFIIIYKPVYQWVESIIYRKPEYGVNMLRQELDKNRYIKVENDITPTVFDYTLSSLVNLYKQTYENWIINAPETLHKNSFIINYVDLLDDTKRIDILNKIKDKYNMKTKGDFNNVPWGYVSQSTQDWRKDKEYSQNMKDYYFNGKGLKLTEKEYKIIDTIIDNNFKIKLKNLTEKY